MGGKERGRSAGSRVAVCGESSTIAVTQTSNMADAGATRGGSPVAQLSGWSNIHKTSGARPSRRAIFLD